VACSGGIIPGHRAPDASIAHTSPRLAGKAGAECLKGPAPPVGFSKRPPHEEDGSRVLASLEFGEDLHAYSCLSRNKTRSKRSAPRGGLQ